MFVCGPFVKVSIILSKRQKNIFFCEFVLVVSYNAEPSLLANLEEEDSRNNAELDQETVRQSEEMMKAFLKATGGEEDSSAKKERTKTIIKTIKVEAVFFKHKLL